MNKKHPLRRIILGTAATVSGVVLLLALKQPGGSTVVAQAGGSVPATGATAPAAGAGASVTGDVVDTQYGPVQVQLTMSGGKIAKAEAVKAPDSTTRSQQITADAVPKLNQEAVTAQSAQVDTVSGATYTSQGYAKSLQSALDKAKSASSSGASGSSGSAAAKSATGDVVQTEYGPVQVKVTVSGGKVTRAEAVQAPNSTPRSQQITAGAVPKLNQEAVTAQSAQVDAVSGATYTSEGYTKSLQSALDKAGV